MSVNLGQLTYVPELGHDVIVNKVLDYNPASYATKEAAAKGLREALIEYAVKHEGYSKGLAEGEIVAWPPERTEKYSGYKQWCVVWEGGPYEWAIGLSMQISGPWGYCEPYYSFDLHFTD